MYCLRHFTVDNVKTRQFTCYFRQNACGDDFDDDNSNVNINNIDDDDKSSVDINNIDDGDKSSVDINNIDDDDKVLIIIILCN